ncbi:unnamed protein product, partial [Polarella glacialis]
FRAQLLRSRHSESWGLTLDGPWISVVGVVPGTPAANWNARCTPGEDLRVGDRVLRLGGLDVGGIGLGGGSGAAAAWRGFLANSECQVEVVAQRPSVACQGSAWARSASFGAAASPPPGPPRAQLRHKQHEEQQQQPAQEPEQEPLLQPCSSTATPQ